MPYLLGRQRPAKLAADLAQALQPPPDRLPINEPLGHLIRKRVMKKM
jgi:hypothetical protein